MYLEWLNTLAVEGGIFQNIAFQQLEKKLHVKLTSQFNPRKGRCWIMKAALFTHLFSLWAWFLFKTEQEISQLLFEVLYYFAENIPYNCLWQ